MKFKATERQGAFMMQPKELTLTLCECFNIAHNKTKSQPSRFVLVGQKIKNRSFGLSFLTVFSCRRGCFLVKRVRGNSVILQLAGNFCSRVVCLFCCFIN